MYSEIRDAFSDQDGSLARQAESTERHVEAQLVEDGAESRKVAGLIRGFHLLKPPSRTMAQESTENRGYPLGG